MSKLEEQRLVFTNAIVLNRPAGLMDDGLITPPAQLAPVTQYYD
jgi:hypothetical protein